MTGASPRLISSSSSSFGLRLSARAIASICCSPPDSSPAFLARSGRSAGKWSNAASVSPTVRRPSSRKCSATVSPKKMPRSCGTWAMPSRARAVGVTPARSAPASRTAPSAGLSSPEMARSVVVLPAPFAPSSATTSPLPTVSVRSRTTGAERP